MRKGNIVKSKHTNRYGLVVEKKKSKRKTTPAVITISILIDGKIDTIRVRRAYKAFEVVA